jgi:hypothetical protein
MVASMPSAMNVTEVLDKSKGNWPTWSCLVTQSLQLCTLGGNLIGKIKCPDAITKTRTYNNWHMNNEICIVFITLKCNTAEQDFIEGKDNIQTIWDLLFMCHEAEGPLTQVLLLQEAFCLCYMRSKPLADTSTKISQITIHIFAIGLPTTKLFCSIIMLNALLDEFSNVHNHIASSMSSASSSTPFDPDQICKHLDYEQQIINARSVVECVNVAQPRKKPGPKHVHNEPYCGTAVSIIP